MRHVLASILAFLPVRIAALLLALGAIALLIYVHHNPHVWNADQHRIVGAGALVVAGVVLTVWERLLAWIVRGRLFWLVALLLAVATLFTASSVSAEVVTFTGIPTLTGATRYTPIIDAAAKRHRVPPALLRAVAHCESNYNPHALSDKGASGLFQLMPATARRYGVINPRDPHEAADGAARYLVDLHAEFGSWELAVAAYNAGETAVRRHGGMPPYNETRLFTSRVMGAFHTATQRHTTDE